MQAGMNEFMCQSWGKTIGELVQNGADLAKIDPRIVVKLPVSMCVCCMYA